MDTSVTIIGLLITILIAIPLFFVFRSNVLNKNKIKAIKKQYSQNNHFNFEFTESQNKKVLALDKKNKGFLLIDFNAEKEFVYFVNLNDVHSCKLVPTTEIKSDTILKLEFEFDHKETKKKEQILFYTIENEILDQVCLHEDHQLAKKWIQIIQDCIAR
jgi:hypothetical protein